MEDPPPHRKISGPKSLSLSSCFLPDHEHHLHADALPATEGGDCKDTDRQEVCPSQLSANFQLPHVPDASPASMSCEWKVYAVQVGGA